MKLVAKPSLLIPALVFIGHRELCAARTFASTAAPTCDQSLPGFQRNEHQRRATGTDEARACGSYGISDHAISSYLYDRPYDIGPLLRWRYALLAGCGLELPVRQATILSLRGGGIGEQRNEEAAGTHHAEDLDEDLYSRQIHVIGKLATARMGKADVLISGLRWEVT